MIGAVLVILALGACGTTSGTGSEAVSEREALSGEVPVVIARFKEELPAIKRWFDDAHAYAVFPSVGKRDQGTEAAFGTGKVFLRDGRLAGYASLSVATLGFQLGGQTFAEIVFFKDEVALDRFAAGDYEFDASASAVAATAAAATTAEYERGVAVFVLMRGGLMYEAAVGGQKFAYQKN
ncbi:MAG: lipid-binding SYLF domain-containing protein [Planctomycetota bacterium]|jgi:lipid-binding SYLF domain-containing protein